MSSVGPGALLAIARETIAKVPLCFAITVGGNGEANARVVQVGKLRVIVKLITDRIELWSSGRDVMPEPKGLSAAVLVRDGSGWQYRVSSRRAP